MSGVAKHYAECSLCGIDMRVFISRPRTMCPDCEKRERRKGNASKQKAFYERQSLRRELELRASAAPLKTEPLPDGKRLCAEGCGKLTTDYRCPACRRAWAKKHGTSLNSDGYADDGVMI